MAQKPPYISPIVKQRLAAIAASNAHLAGGANYVSPIVRQNLPHEQDHGATKFSGNFATASQSPEHADFRAANQARNAMMPKLGG